MTVVYQSEDGWVVALATPGPAGAAAFNFPELTVVVDQLDPTVVCELVIPVDSDAPVSTHPADALTERLFDLPVRRIIEGDDLVLQAAAGEALAALARHDRGIAGEPSSPLHDLDAVFGYSRLGRDSEAKRAARRVLPAAVAVSRAASHTPAIVDDLTSRQRGALLDSYEALLRPELGYASESRVRTHLENLCDLLRDDSVLDVEHFLLLAEERVRESRALRGLRVAGRRQVQVSFTAAPLEVAAWLGEAKQEFVGDIVIDGELPGPIEVTFRLRAGASRRLPGLEARLFAWDGQLLGRAPLEILTRVGELDSGRCAVEAALPDDVPMLRRAGLYADIAVVGAPAPTVERLRRQAQSQARRAGRAAVTALESSSRERAMALWRLSERYYRAAGDFVQAESAKFRARQLDADGVDTGQDERAWLPALLANWQAAAGAQVIEVQGVADADERLRLLSQTARDLSFADRESLVFAKLHEEMAAVAVEAASFGDAASHLETALRVYYELGDTLAASHVLDRLRALPVPVADA